MNEQRIAVLTDSGTDTPADFVARHDITVVPLRINYSDGSSYENGIDITPEEVVRRFDEEVPSTSLPSPAKIMEVFEQARAKGYEKAVFVTISSGLSATHETVRLVASQIEDFPVIVIDTKSIGIGAGFTVMEAARLIEQGVPFEELEDALVKAASRVHVFFSVQSLDFLHEGGRIGDAVYRLGKVLSIKPVFTCDENGRYIVAKKARGWKRALEDEVALVVHHAEGYPKVRIAICSYLDDGVFDRLEGMIRERVDNVVEVLRVGVSADLLVHTGPSITGIGVMGI